MFDVTFFRDRNVEEKKEETKRLEEVRANCNQNHQKMKNSFKKKYFPEQVIERHKLLLPRVKDTQVKSEVN